MEIVGRDRELRVLRGLYDKPGFQFPVVFGRRRVGKTFLLSTFSQGLPCIFFTAVEDSPSINLRNLSREIFAYEHPDSDASHAPVFSDFQTAFETVFGLARTSRLVVVIDEYPYLAKADPSIPSVLQTLIDRNNEETSLFLVLCGSSLTFMREQVLGAGSPLYGRRTAQIELKPLDFFDARCFFPDATPEDQVTYYGMAGGIPLYLQQFERGLAVADNIEAAFLSPDAFLYEEPLNLLRQEVAKAGAYNSVIGAIANGRTTNNEIATAAGIRSSDLTYYLKELQRIGLVERRVPVVGSSRRAVYRLRDNLFSFWYRFVLPSQSMIERGMSRRVLKSIEEHLSEYLGPVFESVSAEWLWRKNAGAELPAEFTELGSWWGNNPTERREEEIDLVGVDEDRVVLVGECKWRNEPAAEDIDDTLQARATLVRADQGVQRYVFSRSGFARGLRERAKSDERLHLIALGDM